MSNYHIVADNILQRLNKAGFWFETFEHEPVRTSEEAAKVRPEYSLSQGAKALILKIYSKENKNSFVMIVFPANLQFSNEKVKKVFSAKKLRFATEEEVSQITSGILPGGVPPFGDIFGLEIVVDPRLYENEKIIFNAGDRSFSIGMKSNDYKSIVPQKIIDIVKQS